MLHTVFHPRAGGSFKIAILVKDSALDKQRLLKEYVNSIMNDFGYNRKDIVAFGLEYGSGSVTAAEARGYLDNNVLPAVEVLGIKLLVVADAAYYKYLTKQVFMKNMGNYCYNEHKDARWDKLVKVIPVPSYTNFFADPDKRDLVPIALSAVPSAMGGLPVTLGNDVVRYEKYYTTHKTMKGLQALLDADHPSLTVDIEAFSLLFTDAGIGTISFCWTKHKGVAFDIDHATTVNNGVRYSNREGYDSLRWFFTNYKGKLIFHGGKYDIKVLVFVLFMDSKLGNREGMVNGIEILTRDYEDTMILTFLAVNSTAGNSLDLKSNTIEYMGNYALEEIKDITAIHNDVLLRYNLEDGCATNFLYQKHYDTIVDLNQEYLYKDVLINANVAIIQLELEGMYLHMDKVIALKDKLQGRVLELEQDLQGSPLITAFNLFLRKRECFLANLKLKQKVRLLEEFTTKEFNPSSNEQVATFLHTFMKVKVRKRTKKKAPSVGRDALLEMKQKLMSKHKLKKDDLL